MSVAICWVGGGKDESWKVKGEAGERSGRERNERRDISDGDGDGDGDGGDEDGNEDDESGADFGIRWLPDWY